MLGQFLDKQYQYELILCDTQRNDIGVIDYTDLSFNARFDSFNELNFELAFYQNGFTNIKDKNFDLTKGLLLVLVNIKKDDEVVYSEYFVINKPTRSNDGTIKKTINCISYSEHIFNNKRLRGYKDTRKLYDYSNPYSFSDNTKGGLLNLLLTNYLYDTWSIGYLNPSLNVYHSFDFPDTSYVEVFKEIEKEYNCFILFNSIQRKIYIYSKSEYGESTDLVLADTNFIKSISNEDKYDQLITRLTITGKDNLGINRYSPQGFSYVENYDWLIDNGYFSDSLKTAWNNYKTLLSSKQSVFDGYITQLETYEHQLLTRQNELAALQAEKLQIEDAMDVEKNTYSSNTSTYDDLYNDLQNKESEISSKQSQISSIQASINSVNTNINTLRNILKYEANFTKEQLVELVEFIKEQSISFSQVSDAKQLYTYAKEYIVKISTPPITFETDNIDIFSAKEGSLVRHKIKIGDYVNIDCPELGFDFYPIRLVAYTHKPLSNSLTMSFSNTDKLENDLALLGKNIFKVAESVSNEVEVKKYDYESYSNEKSNILYRGNTLNTNNNPIVAGDNIITRRGFIGEDIGSYGAIQIKNDKIIFSNSSPLWKEYYTLLSGNGLYLESQNHNNRLVITPSYGIQIDKKVSGQWDNVFYIDTNGNLHIDGGYIELLTENHMNRYIMNPNDAFRIQKNTGTASSPIWTDTFFVTSEGNLIAKMMRTSSDVGNYISLEDQFINFWNGGAKKLQLGFVDIGGTSFPYCIWGQGDGTEGNRAFFNKDIDRFNIVFRTSNGQDNKITFINNNYSNYPLGCIKIYGVVDFGDVLFQNFNYSYSKSQTYTQSEVDNAIADAIADHVEHYHS